MDCNGTWYCTLLCSNVQMLFTYIAPYGTGRLFTVRCRHCLFGKILQACQLSRCHPPVTYPVSFYYYSCQLIRQSALQSVCCVMPSCGSSRNYVWWVHCVWFICIVSYGDLEFSVGVQGSLKCPRMALSVH